MKVRKLLAAVGAAGLMAIAVACEDQASVAPNGVTWVFTPDVNLHRQPGAGPWIKFRGLCTNGYQVWWSQWTPEQNAWSLSQGQTMITNCTNGWATGGGNWGIEQHA